MDRDIILSLFYAEQGSAMDTMERYRLKSSETLKTWEQVAALLTPLDGEALELAAEYGALKEQDGFLNGFRLAVRLLMGGVKVEGAVS